MATLIVSDQRTGETVGCLALLDPEHQRPEYRKPEYRKPEYRKPGQRQMDDEQDFPVAGLVGRGAEHAEEPERAVAGPLTTLGAGS